MSQPIYTVVIDIKGNTSIVERSEVPFLTTKGTSMPKAIKLKEALDD